MPVIHVEQTTAVTCMACPRVSCLDARQVATVRIMGVEQGELHCLVPIGSWRFFVLDGELCGACEECGKTLPPVVKSVPLMVPEDGRPQ